MKKSNLTKVSTSTGFCLMLLLLAHSAKSQTPVFDYTFPASWGGSGTTVMDQSSAGNNGFISGSLSLDSAPSGYSCQSINTTAGGILTSANLLLNNSAVAAAGGFTYNLAFMWNGTDSSSFGHTEKLIDYAGTESLQLITTAGSANLQMQFGDDSGGESIPVSTTILPNTWYNVSLAFNTAGNSLVNGDISGVASLFVNGSLVGEGAATKGTYGDSLNRPIGIGQLGANFGYLVGFKGDIFDPSVNLGVVPEPSTLALSLLGGVGLMGTMLKARRRKV